MKISKRMISIVLALVLLVSTVSITVAAKSDIKYGIAFITGSGLRLRSKASTSSTTLDSASKGEVAVVVSKQGEWYKVIYNLQEGYMHSDYLSVRTRENAELGYGKVNGSAVNLRSGPSTSFKTVARANKGDKAYIIGLNEGWYKVLYGEQICYIRSDFLDLTQVPYENRDSDIAPLFFRAGKSTGIPVSASALKAAQDPDYKEETKDENKNTFGEQMVAIAENYLGTPYVWGGSSPSGFDCSGLVYYVLKTLGYSPYRTASQQYKMGTYVSKDNLQPGDLVFFARSTSISHVGIYVGDGMFIHSPHTGDVVKYSDLTSGYYANHYYGARRVG